MSKKQLPPARVATLKAKTAAIASKLPATRNADGSIKERDKTGGAKVVAIAKNANAGKPWTDKDDARITLLVNAGKTDQEIADDLGRTKTGIQVRGLHLQIDGYLPEGPYTLKIGSKTYPVPTLEQAQRTYVQLRDESGLGASEFSFGALLIGNVQKNPIRVATISYNGRAWQGQEDTKLLAEAPERKPVEFVIVKDKPGNGSHAETLAQVVSGVDESTVVATQTAIVPSAGATGLVEAAKAADQGATQEELAPAQGVDLPMKFLAAALSIAPTDEARYQLNGVLIHQLADNALRLVATDGHRMFVAQFPHTQAIDWAQAGVILPREQLERIAKYVGKNGGLRVEFGLKHPAVKVSEIAGMGSFTFAPIDGKFPDYQKVVDSAAAVFTSEREELSQTTIDSKYLKAAGALSAQLESKGIIPFLAPEGAKFPSVFAFVDVPEALLYISNQAGRQDALPASTVKLFGADAMREQVAKLEEQVKRTLNNAKNAKHAKFRQQFKDKAARLQLRADQLRAHLAPALPAPAAEGAPQSPAATGTAEPAAGVAVH